MLKIYGEIVEDLVALATVGGGLGFPHSCFQYLFTVVVSAGMHLIPCL